MDIDLKTTLLAAATIKDIHDRTAKSIRRKTLDPQETVLAALTHARETLDKATSNPAPQRRDVALRSITCRGSYGAPPFIEPREITRSEAIIDTCNAFGDREIGYKKDDALDRLILDLMVLPRADEQNIASRAGISVDELRDRITDPVRIMMRLAKECPNELNGIKVLPPRLRCLENKCTPGKFFWFFRTAKKEIRLNAEPGQPEFMNEYARARELAFAA